MELALIKTCVAALLTAYSKVSLFLLIRSETDCTIVIEKLLIKAYSRTVYLNVSSVSVDCVIPQSLRQARGFHSYTLKLFHMAEKCAFTLLSHNTTLS